MERLDKEARDAKSEATLYSEQVLKLWLELEKAKAREQEAGKIVAEEKGKNVP